MENKIFNQILQFFEFCGIEVVKSDELEYKVFYPSDKDNKDYGYTNITFNIQENSVHFGGYGSLVILEDELTYEDLYKIKHRFTGIGLWINVEKSPEIINDYLRILNRNYQIDKIIK